MKTFTKYHCGYGAMLDHQSRRERLAPLYTRDRRVRYACEAIAVIGGAVLLAVAIGLIGMALTIICSWMR